MEGEGDKGVREIGEGNKYIDASPQSESERVFTEKKKRKKRAFFFFNYFEAFSDRRSKKAPIPFFIVLISRI